MSVTTTRNGIDMKTMLEYVDDLDDMWVKVGIKDRGSTPEDNLAYRMIVHELGYTVPRAYGGGPKVTIPKRPVFHTCFLDNRQQIHNFMYKELLPRVMLGKIDIKQAKEMLGAWYSGKLKEQFRKKKFAKLSRYYLVRPSGKKVTSSSIPLIDTGEMRNAIEWWW